MRGITLALGLAAVSACGSDPIAPDVGEEFVLAIGESATVAGRGIVITLEDIPEDSRCPSDVVCIQAGTGVVAVTVKSAGRSVGYRVTTSDSSSVVIEDDLELTLRALDPYPLSTRPVEKSDYRARMVVLARLI